MTEPDVGVIPEDPDNPYRLGRNLNHDPRSRRFAFTAPAEVQLKSVYWDRAVPIFDQGNLGSCTGNAAAGWLATANSQRAGLTEAADPVVPADTLIPVDELYARDLYKRATLIDPYDGAWPPDDTGSDGLSVTKVLQALGTVDTYAHAFDVTAALAALQLGPVLVGTNWYTGMFRPVNDGLINGVVEISGSVAGGHEYLLVGYDEDARVVTFANSWGDGWADRGYGHMTVDTLTRLLAENGDATIPHALIAAPTPPPEPPRFLAGLSDRARARMVSRARKAGLTEEAWVTRRIEAETR